MKVALVQINTTVGDFDGNHDRLLDGLARAQEAGATLAVAPELALTGYPPLDLLERPAFIRRAAETQARVVAAIPPGLTACFGNVRRRPTPPVVGRALQNVAVVARRGAVLAEVPKTLLPTYDVFDEARHFEPRRPTEPTVVEIDGVRVGVSICEDLWNDDELWESEDLFHDMAPGAYRLYGADPGALLAEAGVDVIVNLSASPWSQTKPGVRRRLVEHVARRHGVPMVYCNLVGANDGLLFDGRSMFADSTGRIFAEAPAWAEAVTVGELSVPSSRPKTPAAPTTPSAAGATSAPSAIDVDRDLAQALTCGIRDYLGKTGIPRAIVGLSGGIDSAVTAYLAVEALGPAHVLGVAMPSGYSSEHSVADAKTLAENLGIEFHVLPIESTFRSFVDALAGVFQGFEPDVTEENLQSRTRGTTLMAIANKRKGVVLNTGNKSEAAMGYVTLYGDSIGALSVLGDCYKHRVYALAAYANRDREIIPRSSIDKPPSAELRPDQKDEDSLPPYAVLDEVLRRFLEHRATAEEIADGMGIDVAVPRDVIRTVYRNEFKRKQLPPTLRVTRKAWTGRVYPIVQRFREGS